MITDVTIVPILMGDSPRPNGNPTFPHSIGGVLGTDLNYAVFSNVIQLNSGMLWRTLRRWGSSAAMLERHFSCFPWAPFLLNPTLPSYPFVVVFDDYVMATVAAGDVAIAVGFLDHITAMVAASLVGVGFERTAGGEWSLFVKDAPGLVARYVYQKALPGVLTNVPHRLTIMIDGRDHTVTFHIDDVEVGSFTPTVPLDQMGPNVINFLTGVPGAGPYLRYRALVPLNADATIWLAGDGLTAQVRAGIIGWQTVEP